MNEIKIALDVCGCDYPEKMVAGIPDALNQVNNVKLVVFGDEEFIKEKLKGFEFDNSRLEIVNSTEVITNDDMPIDAVRIKKESSLVKALKALKEDKDLRALITAGNTGAILCGAVMIVGRSYGLMSRPALCSLLPNDKGSYTCLADCGASVDCRAEYLVNFAQAGADYARCYLGIKNPKIALLSVGTENKKGNELTHKAFDLLSNSGLNFIGNIEAKTALDGQADVIVSDGFSGNVLLKSIEGTAKTICARLDKLYKKYAPKGFDFGFIDRSFKEILDDIDFNNKGGAVLLGIKKIIIKAHGAAEEETVLSTVKQAIKMIEGGYENIAK